MVNGLRVRRGEGAGPQADYAAWTRLKRGVLSSSSMRACFSLTVVAGIVNVTSSTIASPRPLSVGDIAPEFSLPGSDGRQYSLASYRGRQAVVLVWFAKAFTEG
jgi:hypothetical protein